MLTLPCALPPLHHIGGIGNHADSPLLWLIAGRAALACGDAAAADAALCEANALDPQLAEPWGLLALVSARTGQWDDAAAALAQVRVCVE